MKFSDLKEGYIPVSGGRLGFQIVGSGDTVPLLAFHGGPGSGHNNLEPLASLSSERPVIFYDQLASLILGSTAASMRQFGEELDRLRAQLPTGLQHTLRKYEAAGDYHNSEYQNACFQFLAPLFCRMQPFPGVLMRTMVIFNRYTIPYQTIWGPKDVVMNGNLQDWHRSARLGEISIPTLVLCGRYAEVTPVCSETIHHGIPNSEIDIFENSAHMAHLEESLPLVFIPAA